MYAAILFVAMAFFFTAEGPAEEPLSPVERYLKLERMFDTYDRAMFGSRPYHERNLRYYLSELIYKDIETPFDFVLIEPDEVHKKYVRSKLRHRRWLEIRGDINRDSLREALSGDFDPDKGWRRSDFMFSVSGRITWARISRNPYGRSVELYFDEIILKRK